ncbi:FadR family transcriptional regulator [Amycolatopsis sp. K13G38]|uniref:FadR family transcriptional regulator n=1 Tax=Amycolatopsis acididurans TaxID=2724524 RepID=A0ABX1JEQ5_9PSEU|nr:FadR/GntR family transcriptional regulator [Amycolatopsis acididurans]NKQ56875.1 FadR family transcriptional regulator [Amycolatopsis acididurans]
MTVENGAATAGLRVKRVQAAYRQVADQLKEQILSGALATGTRLPSEAELCGLFGVSRSTVREALRLLASQQLIDTTRGVSGGSFVAAPDAGAVAESLGGALGLLVNANNLSVDNLLEARLIVEPPAARIAAERATAEDLAELRRTMEETSHLDPATGFELHWDFHTTLVAITGNPLLRLMCQPINAVLHSRLHRERIAAGRWREIDEDHQRIYDAVAAGDAEEAERLNRAHLLALRPVYERMKDD